MSAQAITRIVIPANSSARVEVSGKFYATVSTNGTFYVRAGNGSELEQNAGRTFGDQSTEFSVLTFYNRTVTAVTAEYYVGNVPYQPDPSVVATIGSVNVTVASTVKNAPTYTKGTSSTVGGAGTAFSGTDTGGQVRKSFSVFNNEAADSGNNITVRGANGTTGHLVAPQTGYVIEAGGGITLIGSGFAFHAMEVFYT